MHYELTYCSLYSYKTSINMDIFYPIPSIVGTTKSA